MKQTKLSKQQKIILKIIYKNQKKNRAFKYDNREISKKVYAEQYNIYPEYGDLNPSHSASVSRSAKRLEDRGLIGRNKPVSMFLTDKGMKYCRSLFGAKLDKHKIGRYKKRGAYEIVAHKVQISPESFRKSKIIKEHTEKDKTTKEDWEVAKKGKMSLDDLYRQVKRRKAIKEIEKEYPEVGKDLRKKKPMFTLKEAKDLLSGK